MKEIYIPKTHEAREAYNEAILRVLCQLDEEIKSYIPISHKGELRGKRIAKETLEQFRELIVQLFQTYIIYPE